MMNVYVDLDGVLVDFDSGYEKAFGYRPSKEADNVNWDLVRVSPGFYENLDPMPDAFHLWDYLAGMVAYDKIWSLTILTGVPKSVEAAKDEKRAWVAKHLGPHRKVITCLSKQKSQHCKPGDVLIDDWEKYRQLWVDRGGHWITHRTASESIDQFMDYYEKVTGGP